MLRSPLRALTLSACLFAGVATAQTTQVALGGIRTDPNAPVEIEADRLVANQEQGSALFSGNVIVAQGPMILSAPQVEVYYSADGSGGMDRVRASGGVTMTSGTDAAEGQEAVYTVESGVVVMTGNVLLTQGNTTLSGQRFVADLSDGTGVMEGRVSVVIPANPDPANPDTGDGSN